MASVFTAAKTQLYVVVSPGDTANSLFNCILDMKAWTSQNVLQLNQDKTVAQREKVSLTPSVLEIKPCNEVKNLGVILDSDLNFTAHVRSVPKTALYHLKNISRVRLFLSLSNTETLLLAFINNRLNC